MTQKQLEELLSSMSLQEKIDQMLQLGSYMFSDSEAIVTGPMAEMGLSKENLDQCGSILGSMGAQMLIDFQKGVMERQPHHIPMLFMMDIIHGAKTIFPMPLALSASFDPEMVKEGAQIAAKEASVAGLHCVFSPMVDVSRDARWGRCMESPGEDPYLNGVMAKAHVEGFQGKSLSEPYSVAACVKHYAGYGGAEAGRDYNTVQLTEHTFRQEYLTPYREAVKAGSALVMSSFNTVNDIPASTNRWLMRDILRDEMGFEGVLISDFAAIQETIAHGYSEGAADAAKKALEAGLDIDMMTSCYSGNLAKLVEAGEVEEALIDESVMRILKLKNALGLFENPFKDADPEKEKDIILCQEHREAAREAAEETAVLLKNDGLLPLDLSKKIAFIGPYVNCAETQSSWAVAAEPKDTITLQMAAEKIFDPERTTYLEGCPRIGADVKLVGFEMFGNKISGKAGDRTEEEWKALENEAVNAAREADMVVMPLGEHYLQTGEATSRAFLDIPEVQMELFRKVAAVNDNIVVVLYNGRPLDLREISRKAKSILEVWFPGTEGGPAIVNLLTGKANPSGKLPMSFPYCVGQCPVYYGHYATGRPIVQGVEERFKSKYIDIPNEPLYPFGYGLSYTTFEISPVTLSKTEMTKEETITASVIVKNTGAVAGTEVVQLYLQDCFGSTVRPVKELKGFERVTLQPGEEKEISFTITEEMLQYYTADFVKKSEPGQFVVYIGDSSMVEEGKEFSLLRIVYKY